MAHGHGGKRAGAGRPRGATSISAKMREAAQQFSIEALRVVAEIMRDESNPQRLRAAQMIIDRAHGTPKESSISYDIITQFIDGQISAVQACLILESEGIKIPANLQAYCNNQIAIENHIPFDDFAESLNQPPKKRPKS